MTHAFHVTLKMKQKQYYILSANQMLLNIYGFLQR